MFARAAEFADYYVETGGSSNSARSYVSYLRTFDRMCGGMDEMFGRLGTAATIDWAAREPNSAFGGNKAARDIRSALRRYGAFLDRSRQPTAARAPLPSTTSAGTAHVSNIVDEDVIISLIQDIKTLATRYYRLTGKPLGVTGELAELEAAQKLGLGLMEARTAGYDAFRKDESGRLVRVQIKGRAVDPDRRYVGRCPAIKCGVFDEVVLVLFDRASFEPLEMWHADESAVAAKLALPGSKARNERSSLGISQFRALARKIWPCTTNEDEHAIVAPAARCASGGK